MIGPKVGPLTSLVVLSVDQMLTLERIVRGAQPHELFALEQMRSPQVSVHSPISGLPPSGRVPTAHPIPLVPPFIQHSSYSESEDSDSMHGPLLPF